MKVIEVEWGAWFKLEDDGKFYFSILCQIGRGSNDLEIEWVLELENEKSERNYSQRKMLDQILNNYYEYKHLQVNNVVREKIATAITKFNEKT